MESAILANDAAESIASRRRYDDDGEDGASSTGSNDGNDFGLEDTDVTSPQPVKFDLRCFNVSC